METETIIKEIKTFCKSHHISTDGCLMITIQRNRSTDYASLVIDFTKSKIVPNYPKEITSYDELKFGEFNVCYKANLDCPDYASTSDKQFASLNTQHPFCCDGIQLYKATRTVQDKAFMDFVAQRGSHPSLVYRVARQVNNGPLIATQYFTLNDGKITEVNGGYTSKIHAFKNFKCNDHDLFFGVDLFNATNASGYNYHHMRLHPFTSRNQEVLKAFFLQQN